MASEFTVRPDSVDVEQIMGRIRERISETRGTDYTEKEIREIADVTIAKLLDPSSEGSDLLTYFLKRRAAAEAAVAPPGGSSGRLLGALRWILSPLLRPFIKLNSLRHALWELRLNFALIHNLIIEVTRAGIEIRNLKMRVESLATRLDFSERRARSLEHPVQHRPSAHAPAAAGDPGRAASPSHPTSPPARRDADPGEGAARGDAQRRRRRRRRGRGSAGGPGQAPADSASQQDAGSATEAAGPASDPDPSASAIPDRDTTDQ